MDDEHGRYWSRVASAYDAVVDRQIGGRTRELVRERLAREDRLGDAAEFACGTGYFTGVLAGRAERLIATDLSPGMLEIARQRVRAANVSFGVEDCQETSFAAHSFDTAFMSLVIHFVEPERALREMHRILKPGGALIVANLDMHALSGAERARAWLRVVFRGATGYRAKPPGNFGRNLRSRAELCALLAEGGFSVAGEELVRDTRRRSNIPVDYLKAIAQ